MHAYTSLSIAIIACVQCNYHVGAFSTPHPARSASLVSSTSTSSSSSAAAVVSPSHSRNSLVTLPMFSGDEPTGLEEVSESTGDAFEDYVPGQEKLASKDTILGTGDAAQNDNVLTVNYKGTVLKSGKVFDEGTFTFKLGARKVMPGWDLGLVGMQVGGTRILKIPPTLAYGRTGAGDAIPPNADLRFECELVKVGDGAVAEAMMAADGFVNRLKSPRGLGFAVLFAASFLIPKDANIGDIFAIFDNVGK